MAAEVGQGEAEEPEQSDGNRLYGSIADKKRLGEKGLRRFMTIKKAEIFHDLDCSIQLVAEVGQGGAEEPERSNGNRLYGSIVSKKRMGEKGLRRFMTIKKAEIFYDFGCSIQLVAEVGQGEAEEPERSDGNRLYGSIADKKANESKRITAFYDNKKSRNLLRLRLLY